jgi:hypothetical protein
VQLFEAFGEVTAARGPVALSRCTTAHPLHTIFANIFGGTTMRPNPTQAAACRSSTFYFIR